MRNSHKRYLDELKQRNRTITESLGGRKLGFQTRQRLRDEYQNNANIILQYGR